MKHVLTNVRLSLATLKGLKHRAVEERRPAAALVREAVEQYLTRKPETNVTGRGDCLRRVIGVAGSRRGAPSDLAVNHDHYLYGAPRKGPRRARPG